MFLRILPCRSTVVLLLQTILLFFGIGDGGVDADVSDVGGLDGADMGDLDASEIPSGSDTDGLTVFFDTGYRCHALYRRMVGNCVRDIGMTPVLAIVLAVVLGVAALFGMAFLMRALTRFQSSGNIVVENAVGKIGKVYLTIPGEMAGSGKINITVQDTYTEFEAVTAECLSHKDRRNGICGIG